MKKLTILYILVTITLIATAQPQPQPQPQSQPQPFHLDPIPSVTIPVTVDKMTNLVFPESIQAGVKVSTEIIAQKVHGIENVIEIKALRRHFTTTNLTVYGKDGQLYSFILQYVDDTEVLNFRVLPAQVESTPTPTSPIHLSTLPTDLPTLRSAAKTLESLPPHLHTKTKTDHLTLRLTGVYSKDNLQWLTFNITNRSTLDFHPETIRFYLQDKKKVRRRAIQEIDLQPIFQDNLNTIANGKNARYAAAFNPFHVKKGKRLIAEFTATDGRSATIRLSAKRAARARAILTRQAAPEQAIE